jgi:hypothetical protein
MKITNNYQHEAEVYWRLFSSDDYKHAFGLKECLLKKDAVAEWDGSDIVQIEFKRTGLRVSDVFIREAGPLFSSDGEIVLQADGTVFQHANPWSLPATKYTEWMNNDVVQDRTLLELTLPSSHDRGAAREAGARGYVVKDDLLALRAIISDESTGGGDISGSCCSQRRRIDLPVTCFGRRQFRKRR